MADKPIVLTKQNVCAVLERRKFQTKRLGSLKRLSREADNWELDCMVSNAAYMRIVGRPDIASRRFPSQFEVDDRAYVKEAYRISNMDIDKEQALMVHYLADRSYKSVDITDAEMKLFKARKHPFRATPGRFMYKSLARIFLPIVEVRIERLQDISESDAKAEGVYPITTYRTETPYKDAFRWLWVSIHGAGAWERNPWVLVYGWDEIIIKGE